MMNCFLKTDGAVFPTKITVPRQLQELPEARVEVGEVEYNVQASMDDMDGLELTARVQERAHSLSLQHLNEITRLGGEQMQFVQTQAAKQESGQASIQATLTPLEVSRNYEP